MQKLLEALRSAYPELRFSPGKAFYWSPESQEVFYREKLASKASNDDWSLLHETGHALLQHKSYVRDLELIKLEMAAWDKALELARQFKLSISETHIQNCLDTYRDWLHARSICPSCTTKSFQQLDPSYYRCHNCHTTWQVTPARFARAYRSVSKSPQTTTIFAAEA